MFLALWYYLHGYVMIEVSGFSVERFVNMAAFRGIYLWNIQPKGSAVQMNVSAKGYNLLAECAEKTGCRYEMVCLCGLPAVLKKYKKRKVLSLGILIFVGILYALSSFVWVVEVQGNERIEKQQLLKACQEAGMAPGTLKWNIHTDDITQYLLETFEDISWVSVSIDGTEALIRIVETIPKPEIIDKQTPSDLVAKKDSVIQSIITEAGTPMVQSGDVVKKGDVLISGEVVLVVGDEEEAGREYVNARGTVLAKTWYTLEEELPLSYTEKKYTGIEKKDKSLLIGDTIINIMQPNMEDGSYEKKHTGGNQLAIGDFKLPLSWAEETYQQYETIQKTRTEQEAKKQLETQLKQKAEEMVQGEIENIEIQYEVKDDTLLAKATITVIEDIAQQQKKQNTAQENIMQENQEEL